ncbi:hypothetical protein F4781DRAFT_436704 [Annulohypoxylon bovei var. microspora]|nr:hypothetical protein F4781DRAFT_436704 [Annulohypoxylon bovei var. microspora]
MFAQVFTLFTLAAAVLGAPTEPMIPSMSAGPSYPGVGSSPSDLPAAGIIPTPSNPMGGAYPTQQPGVGQGSGMGSGSFPLVGKKDVVQGAPANQNPGYSPVVPITQNGQATNPISIP